MICRASRDRLATALRRYVSGRINNDELSDIRVDWRDRGAVAVQNAAWTLYSDNKQHYATGKHAITKDGKRGIARWVVFLHSDEEYLWPEYSFIQIVNWPMNILTFGWWERQKRRRWAELQRAGEFAAWPFSRVADADRVVGQPRFFAGHNPQ